MKTISRYIITLALLLTAVTGAWAQSTLNVVEFAVPAAWETDNSDVTAADLPGFKASTLEEAKAWTGAPAEGMAILIYAFNGDVAHYVSFFNGEASDGMEYAISKAGIFDEKSNLKFYYTAEAGPKVAWDAATKTGTFSMPGSDVVLTPIYAKAAAFATTGTEPEVKTLLPEAAEGVIAGTDASLIADGTGIVAFAGESTEVTQGTLMYAIGTSDTQAPALTAFSATVPTAKDYDDAATLYVWYYIQGADAPDGVAATLDNTFDNTEPACLTVQVLTNKFDITYAEGTQDADKWTVKAGTDGSFQSLPLKGVKAGTKVKLKYDGDRSMLKGVKAEKKAAAGIVNPVVGQVIGSDGKNYDANATLPDGVTAVAVIAYVGSETGDDTYKNGLAIALADESNSNWSTAKSTCEGKSAVSGAAWLLPSQKQWKTMFKANGGNEGSYSGLNTAIGTAGGTALQVNERYWSSSELDADFAWVLVLGENSAGWDGAPEDLGHQVRACLAF